jgi:hypothetical protein
MKIHSQLFDRYEPLILEPLIGHAGLRQKGARKPPEFLRLRPTEPAARRDVPNLILEKEAM